jgi:hypothetical protein
MDIGRSFTYMFEDRDWVKKIFIGGVVSLIPIVNFAVTGYFIEAIRNTAEGRELPLPEWDDFGSKFVKGFMVSIAIFLYALPLMLVMGIVLSPIIITMAGSSDSDAAANVASSSLIMCNSLLYMYMIPFVFILTAPIIQYALTEQFGVFFHLGDIIAFIKANLGGYIIALVVSIGTYYVAQIVGGIGCCIGIFFTFMWAMLVSANLLGNLARQAQPATD